MGAIGAGTDMDGQPSTSSGQGWRVHNDMSGLIGLGNIGKPMALNVVGAGHRTTVHDIRREAATDVLEAGRDVG